MIILGFILYAIIFATGFWSFSREFRLQYDANMISLGKMARDFLNPDDFDDYLESGIRDLKYKAISDIFQNFVDKFELNLLYVSQVEAPDYTNITYIYNLVKKDRNWNSFPLGYKEKYVEPNYNKSVKKVLEQNEIVIRHTFKTRNGSHITVQLPVKNSVGETIAVIGLQKSIQEFVNARYSFITLFIVIGLFFTILFILLFSIYFNTKFLKPIMLITHETARFASYSDKPSDSLLEINQKDELGVLAHSLHQMEVDVCKNIKELTQITSEKERMETELTLAAKIQREMLPKQYPPYPEHTDFDLIASMKPAKEVGGDLYDYTLIDEDHLMICVGDVSGKGVGAALFMGKSKVLIDFFASHTLSPAEIMEKVNNQLCIGNESGLFVTCWLGILTFSTGELRFVNAGHPYPLLCKSGEVSFLQEKSGLVLGYMENLPYKEHCLRLEKGDRIFIYSDGITEATNKDEELFGDDRLLQVIANNPKANAPETLKKIQNELDSFVGDAEQFDDITMLDFIWQNAGEI